MSTTELSPGIIPLEPGLSLRFYEAVLLLYCLKEVMSEAKSVKEPDLESDAGRSSRDSFRCFVNKLSQICDNERRGRTVTAFAVLRPGLTQYRFASNQRTNEELNYVKAYIDDILLLLGSTPEDQLSDVFGTVLEKVIAFNQPVIKHHIKNLTQRDRMDFCAKVCEEEDTAEAQEAARDIDSLRRFSLSGEEPSIEDFVTQTRGLLETINRLHNSSFEGFLRGKARADRDPTIKTPWSELRHAFGRLHSYTVAVNVLISMRRRRQELFEDFEVVAVPSSVRSSCPHVRRTVDGILKRFPEKMNMAEVYHASLPDEQKKAMEKKVKKYGNGSKEMFKPYVHAELLLLNSILTEEQRDGVTLRFFAEADYDRYIGCSKPTCRLCKLYIDNHPSGVEFRGGHGNIYHEWRAPDICHGGGVNVEKAKKTRQNIHNKMLEALRERIRTTLADKVVERNHHDSNTTPTSSMGTRSSTCYQHLAAQAATDRMDSMSTTGAMDDSDDVATTLGRLTMAGDSGRSWTSVSRSSQTRTPISDSKAGSPSGLPVKAFIDRRQRPLIIEVDE
ncbi:hypothetical protein QBC32DRAFT_268069 [Pseudoneurospora amorphoporcata]|uniref:Uncharacterized protein n=1 Tax=Pseudoneurospora amorphoporcata TaxID=241081 RepID=A0AAN6NNE3_9PEZI|nr:hypothetical protein QBC32DRAFT_268069 [Pseudoneurospora amorphoporcata]